MESFNAARIRAIQAEVDTLWQKNLAEGQALRDARQDRLAPFLGHDHQSAGQVSAGLHVERNMHPVLQKTFNR